jgi:myo-inositol-1(or 4)-monophosphatase
MATPPDLDWLHPELDRCRELTRERLTARHWTKASPDGDRELVTEIDLAVDALLTEAIHTHAPRAAILSEESNPDPAALVRATCFVLDPIDGTVELAAGRPGYAISIAVFHNGRPTAALLDFPAYERRFQCAAGRGAYLNGKRIALSAATTLRQARLAVSATQYRMRELHEFWAAAGAAKLTPTPAFAAKFGAVLAGDSDAALYLPVKPHRTAIWDYAAAASLLVEAGGCFSSPDGEDLLERLPITYHGGWVAAPKPLYEQLVALTRQAKQQLARRGG